MGNKTQGVSKVEMNPAYQYMSMNELMKSGRVQSGMLDQGLPSTYVGISDPRQQGLEQAQQTASGGSMVPETFLPEYQKVMSGGYLDAGSNPYLQDIVNRSVSSATSPILGMNAGQFGGGVYSNALASTAQDTASRLYGAQYEQERQRMMEMAGMTPMANQLQYADAQALMDVGGQYEADEAGQKAEEMRQFMFPAMMQQWMNQQVSGSPMSMNTTTTQSKPYDWLDVVGGILKPPIGGGGGGMV